MTIFRTSVATVLVTFLSFAASSASALELSRYFSNGMVLQRDKPVKIWGSAKKDATVTVSFAGQTKSAKADDSGRWEVTLDPMPASAEGRKMILVSSINNQQSSTSNIQVGDVFLLARQSSIDVTLGAKPEGKKEAQQFAANQAVRFIRIQASPAKDPQDNLKQGTTRGWTLLDKTSALTMSATGFYFCRDLAKQIDVPLGVVDLDMSYYLPLAWVSERGLDEAVARKAPNVSWYRETMPKQLEKWEAEKAAQAKKKTAEDQDAPKMTEKTLGQSPLELPYYPSACYNGVIHPLRGVAFKGILLQLGNDYPFLYYTFLRNEGKVTDRKSINQVWGRTYSIMKKANAAVPQLLPVVPADWRRSLGEALLPMAWIMPPGSDVYDYAIHNREVREVQCRAQQETSALDLILPGTEHIQMSGQPKDDALLAARCVQWAVGTFYKTSQPASGPLFDRFEWNGEQGVVYFKPGTANGLTARGKELGGFEVAGADGNFTPCNARVEGETVILASEALSAIVLVRYDWKNKPTQDLVNSAGLPALPFTSDRNWTYDWWPATAPIELPAEYHTTADTWPDRSIAIINQTNKLAGGGKGPHPNYLGPTGVLAAPFGPNLYVHRIQPMSPADGKVLRDDIIYGVNGNAFTSGDVYQYNVPKIAPNSMYREYAAAITLAESEAGGGRMILNIRRNGKLIEVPLELTVLGTYSSTTPFHCQKSRRIVQRAEEWLGSKMRPAEDYPKNVLTHPWYSNMLFVMAAGNPQYQGLVRRTVYSLMEGIDLEKEQISCYNGWGTGYRSLLFGEYYHRTGDPNVLPYIDYDVEGISMMQIRPPDGNPYLHHVATTDEQIGSYRGGRKKPKPDGKFASWRGLPPTGRTSYGLMPACDMPMTMGLVLARQAGRKVDDVILSRALRHLNYKRAQHAYVEYSYSGFRLDAPRPIDPVAEANGMVISMNGKLGTAAALFQMTGGYSNTVDICARHCVYAFNNTRTGHGGHWLNNFWTPIGAHLSGEKGFQHFMKGQTWWRELYRLHDGSISMRGNGNRKSDAIGVAYAIHRVAYHKRLRMLGAPKSAFFPNPPAYLDAALDAHRSRDYALAEELILKEMNSRVIPADELPTVRHFLETVQTLRKSIDYDLAYVEGLIEAGRYYNANLELPQLKGVAAANNPKLQAITASLESPEAKARIAKSVGDIKKQGGANYAKKMAAAKAWAEKPIPWVAVVKDNQKAGGRKGGFVFPEKEWNRWRMQVLETRKHAPEGWYKPDFDDSQWLNIVFPNTWRPGHTALLRTTFEVENKDSYDAVRAVTRLHKQRNVQMYINGHLVAKINNVTGGGIIHLTDYALEVMKNGTNTLAIVTHNHKRPNDFAFRVELREKAAPQELEE